MSTEVTTDAELFDLLHRHFGVGDWSDDDDRPWHKFRMVEIAKIKAIRRKRRISIADFVMLADHCHRRRRPIKQTFDLLQYWPDAVRERTANARSQVDGEIARALEVERLRPDGDEWVQRLLLAQGGGRQIVLQRWRAEREGVPR